MSRHWIALRQEALEDGKDIQKVLDELAIKNPALAKRLQKIKWAELRAFIAKQALEDTAAHFKMCVTTNFVTGPNPYGSPLEKPKGDIIGMLQTSEERFGVANENGKLRFFHTQFAHGPHDASTKHKEWKKHFEARRQIRTLEAVARIIGKNPQSNSSDDGTVTVSFMIEEVLQ